MKKSTIALEQLCMLFLDRNATLVCDVGDGSLPAIGWLPCFAFNLSDDVRNIQLVHLSEKPKSGEYSYYLEFYSEDDPEYFAFAGDCNEACAAVCKMLTEYAKLLRESFIGSKEEQDAQRLAQCFRLHDLDHYNPFGRTEIIYISENGDAPKTIAYFDTAINLPFGLIEQRKTDSLGIPFPWGHDEDGCGNKAQKTASLSRLFAHFSSRDDAQEKIPKPIEVPLRVDGTDLPILLFDYMMILGEYVPGPPKKAKGPSRRNVDTDL